MVCCVPYNLLIQGLPKVNTKLDPNLKYYECCFRCLVFIGDLGMETLNQHILTEVILTQLLTARYHRDLDEPAMQSNDIENARSYYMRAHRLMPSYGNPHNQLAVLSTYEDDSINALYRYYRAIGSAHPFTTAAYDTLNCDSSLLSISTLHLLQ